MSRPSFARLPCRRSFASSSSRSAYAFPRERNPSLWKVLGVEEGASIADVKAAYYQRVRSLHPDVANSTPDDHPIPAKDRFHLLQTAYETLGNADKRASYINKSRVDPIPFHSTLPLVRLLSPFFFAQFGNHAFTSSSTSPPLRRDVHYRPHTSRWTTWEGRTDYGNANFHPGFRRPHPTPRTGPDLFSSAWRQSRQSPPYGTYHASKLGEGQFSNDRVVTWLLCWMFFGALLAENQASSATAVYDAHHDTAVASLRSAEESARSRGAWRPLVESRLARHRARIEAEEEAHFQAEVLARMQAEFRAQHPPGSTTSRGLTPPSMEEAVVRSKEMIEEELRRSEEERRLAKLEYPEGFVGPRQQMPGMVKVRRERGRPLTGKERRKELQAAGVREPRNPKKLLEEREKRMREEAVEKTVSA